MAESVSYFLGPLVGPLVGFNVFYGEFNTFRVLTLFVDGGDSGAGDLEVFANVFVAAVIGKPIDNC